MERKSEVTKKGFRGKTALGKETVSEYKHILLEDKKKRKAENYKIKKYEMYTTSVLRLYLKNAGRGNSKLH
jgi:hypothetical protein